MLYSALCLDNTAYFEKGTIRVRIFEYYSVPRKRFNKAKGRMESTDIDDLSITPTELNVGVNASLHKEASPAGKSADFECMVFSPLGGGRNYGMFALPKTNEKGVVTFLDRSFSKPLWMGSYFEPLRNENYSVGFVNAPNEDPDQEGADKDLAKDGDSNTTLSDSMAGDQNTIILRTKTTTPDDTNEKKMDWEDITGEVSTENLVAIDSKKVRVRHFTQWNEGTAEKYQEILIAKDDKNSKKETIRLEVNNTSDEKQSYVEITEDGFNYYMNNDGDTTIFKLGVSAESDSLYFKDKDDNTIIGNGTALYVNGEEESIVLYDNLKDILEQLMEHIHIGVVPTKGPLSPKKAKLKYTQQVTNMEGTLIKSKHKRE